MSKQNHRLERQRLACRQIRERFPVQVNVGKLEPVDHLRVCHLVLARPSIDRLPQADNFSIILSRCAHTRTHAQVELYHVHTPDLVPLLALVPLEELSLPVLVEQLPLDSLPSYSHDILCPASHALGEFEDPVLIHPCSLTV